MNCPKKKKWKKTKREQRKSKLLRSYVIDLQTQSHYVAQEGLRQISSSKELTSISFFSLEYRLDPH